MEKISPEFKEHNNSLNQNKNLEGRFCTRPFRLLEIHKEFYAFPCCPSWLPVIVGNPEKTSIMEVWNNSQMQQIRQSIHDGSFRYCDHLECPEIQANRLPKKEQVVEFKNTITDQVTNLLHPPEEIALCYDETCNLACPSCRTQKIAFTEGTEFERRVRFTEKVIELIDQYASKFRITLRVTGSGDPIASPIFYKLLKSLDAEKHPLLRVSLQTNGVMLTEKVWDSLSKIHSCIESVGISIDAASEQTYQKVRRFGSWMQLSKNLIMLSKLRENNILPNLNLNFVVQKENYNEMSAFVEMAQHLKFIDQVFFSFLNDWDTWSKEEYEKQCIWKSDHPEFGLFMQSLRSPLLDDPRVHLGNITEYRVQAMNQ